MGNSERTFNRLVSAMLFLSIVSLFLEYGLYQASWIKVATNVLDYIVFLLFVMEIALRLIGAKYRWIFIRQNAFELLFLLLFLTLFVYSKYVGFLLESRRLKNLSRNIIVLRNIFILIKLFVRLRKFNTLMQRITRNPAQSVLFSFVTVIIVGTLLLMLPLSTSDRTRLGFIDSLFTSTSAVCVTGLIVVDTATRFSAVGKILILILIQIGGLGIMILSYFGTFVFRRTLSVERKLMASYMLNEQDMSALVGSMKSIVLSTFIIEGTGFVLLWAAFRPATGSEISALSHAAFHSVSAFCNAGFSLFTDNLAGFKSNLLLNLTVAALIILGGLSFTVLMELYRLTGDRIRGIYSGRYRKQYRVSLNTRVVLLVSSILILLGVIIIYPFEHRNSLIEYPLGTQYLAAFFQSVTLRTAGFNTIPFEALNRYTYLVMVLFMFIGGASGSTAGGVKVNTVAIIGGYVRSILRNRDDVTIFNQTLSKDLVNRALFIVFVYAGVVFTGTLILSISENAAIVPLFFEVVSAAGTVGLSAGITSSLSVTGKIVIIALMFIGRVGPLTVVVSLSPGGKSAGISYPRGNISLG
ncbi:MAG: TrkH family potassium uptake protein [Spirochaetes bacterium]|nr:TrkH family potassium uptake protein [Spirochaetota bacterium]